MSEEDRAELADNPMAAPFLAASAKNRTTKDGKINAGEAGHSRTLRRAVGRSPCEKCRLFWIRPVTIDQHMGDSEGEGPQKEKGSPHLPQTLPCAGQDGLAMLCDAVRCA